MMVVIRLEIDSFQQRNFKLALLTNQGNIHQRHFFAFVLHLLDYFPFSGQPVLKLLVHLRDLARIKIDFAVERLGVYWLQKVPLLSVHLLPTQFGLGKLLEVIILLFIKLFVAFASPGVFNFILEEKVVFLKPIFVSQLLLFFQVA